MAALTTTGSSSISPFLTHKSVNGLLQQDPTSIPLLSAKIHLLANSSTPTPTPSALVGQPSKELELLETRIQLVKLLLSGNDDVRAESEVSIAEKEAKKAYTISSRKLLATNSENRSASASIVSQATTEVTYLSKIKDAWLECMKLMVQVQVRLGRDGRAKTWREKLEKAESES